MKVDTRNEQHWINVNWINRQIRICLLARKLLINDRPDQHQHLLRITNEFNRPDLIPLKRLIEPDKVLYALRFSNYDKGILSKVFDIEKWIFEARSLNWKKEGF